MSTANFVLPAGFSFPDDKSKEALSPALSSTSSCTFAKGSLKLDNGPTFTDTTTFQIAALVGNLDLIKSCPAAQKDAEIKTAVASENRSIVEFAARGNQVKVLEYLVSEFGKAFVDSQNERGFSPICAATQHGAVDAVKFLHEKCGVSASTIFGKRQHTLLHLAVRKNRLNVVEYLLKTGSVDKEAKLQVVSAVTNTSSGEKEKTETTSAGDVEIAGEANIFSLACAECSVDMLTLLLKEQAHIQNLLEATGSSKQTIVKEGEEKKDGINSDKKKNDDDNDDNNGAPKLKQEKVVFKKFSGFPVMPGDQTKKLEEEAAKKPTETNKPLASYVMHLERKRDIVNSPLHCACANGNFEAVKFLLERTQFDCDKNARVSGATPLFLAARFGHTEIVRYLVRDARVEVDKTSGEGAGSSSTENNANFCSPLFAASFYNKADIVKLLIDNNASSSLTYRGASPLIGAIASEAMESLKVLVEMKSDLTSTYKGDSPLAFAKSEGKEPVIKFLNENKIQ